MKISTASKKVLASALSAAMVIAFAPAVALAEDAGAATLTYVDKAGVQKTVECDTVQKALNEAAKATGATKVTITLADNAVLDSDLDIAGIANGVTIDLNGKSISASAKYAEDAAANAGSVATEYTNIISIAAASAGQSVKSLDQYTGASALYFVKASGTLSEGKTIENAENGDIVLYEGEVYKCLNAVADNAGKAGYYSVVEKIAGAGTTGDVVIKNGTINTIQAANDYAAIDAKNGNLTLDGVKIASEAETPVTSTGAVKIKGDSEITIVKATGAAEAIDAATVTIEAGTIAATSKDDAATAIDAGTVTVKGGTITATGKSADTNTNSAFNYGTDTAVIAVDAATKATVEAGTLTAKTTSDFAKGALAIYSNTAADIKGGTFNGKYVLPVASVSGGSFSEDLSKIKTDGTELLAEGYAAKDDGAYSVVYKSTVALAVDAALSSYKTNNIADAAEIAPAEASINAAALAAAQNAADDIFGNMAKTETVGYKLGEGFTADQVKAILSDETKSALVKVAVNFELIDAESKSLTDAQKAVVATANEAAAKTMDKAKYVETVSVEVKYRAAGERDYVTLIAITDFGTTVDGRNTILRAVNMPGASLIENGTATKLDKTKNNGVQGTWATKTGLYAVTTVDYDAIKDAAGKGEEAVEKATQSIDVAQKSKTVKLSGAKKTKKAVTFKLGASAETALTISKKSGSSRITVSGQNVRMMLV